MSNRKRIATVKWDQSDAVEAIQEKQVGQLASGKLARRARRANRRTVRKFAVLPHLRNHGTADTAAETQ